MKRRLYIFGMQNFAEMAHYLFSQESDYEIAGFLADAQYLDRSTFLGLPAIAYERFKEQVTPEDADLFVAIGVGKINTLRAQKVDEIAAAGYRLASFVSPSARLPKGLAIGPNTMIMDQVNIHPQVVIGRNTVIWSNSRIALKASIGDHVWITSAVIGDSSRVGDFTFVGLNATIAPFVNVGSHNLIGAAALISKDTRDYQVFRGVKSSASAVSSLRLRNIEIIR